MFKQGDKVYFKSNWDKFGNYNYYKSIDLSRPYTVKFTGTYIWGGEKNKNLSGNNVVIDELDCYGGWIPVEVISHIPENSYENYEIY